MYSNIMYISWVKKDGGMASKSLVGTRGAPCQKITTKYVVLNGEQPFNRPGSALAGPARKMHHRTLVYRNV